MPKILLVCFGIACIVVAFNLAVNMFVTFAPAEPLIGFAAGEEATIERMRNYFSLPAFAASGLLAIVGVWIVISTCCQRRVPE